MVDKFSGTLHYNLGLLGGGEDSENVTPSTCLSCLSPSLGDNTKLPSLVIEGPSESHRYLLPGV